MIVLRTTVMDDYGILLALLRSTIRILMIHSNQDRIIPHDSFVNRATTYETVLGYYECYEIFLSRSAHKQP
jgi:hypothetical protein